MLPPMIIYKGAVHHRGWYTELEEAEGDADVKGAWRGTVIYLFNPDAVLTKLFVYISEVRHYYRPPPLNPTSFSTHHKTAEISVSRPSILLPSFTQISSFYK